MGLSKADPCQKLSPFTYYILCKKKNKKIVNLLNAEIKVLHPISNLNNCLDFLFKYLRWKSGCISNDLSNYPEALSYAILLYERKKKKNISSPFCVLTTPIRSVSLTKNVRTPTQLRLCTIGFEWLHAQNIFKVCISAKIKIRGGISRSYTTLNKVFSPE